MDKKMIELTDDEKRKALTFGATVLIANNFEGNMDEPFIGMKGTVMRIKKNDWYQIALESETSYGKKFNFHLDELVIL